MLLNYINEITIYIMEDVAIHGSSGNDVYKVVPKDEEMALGTRLCGEVAVSGGSTVRLKVVT